MSNTIEYRGYVGSVEFSEEDSMLYGKLLGIGALVDYDGNNVEELISDFHTAVDDYLIFCEERGIVPEKPGKTLLDVELDNALYEKLKNYISEHRLSFDSAIESAIGQYVATN